MKKRQSKKHGLRIVSQLVFLAVFVFLVLRGRLQLWMPVFAGGVLVSFLFSRFYCGWMCPMGTLFRPVRWIYSRLGIKRFKTPLFFRRPVIRYIILVLMAAVLVVSFRLQIRVNILLYITVASVIITLFFEETFFHHYLCPYGALLNLSSRTALASVKIDEENCTSCGLCQKVCPPSAIVTLESKKRHIVKNECLACFKCQEICPVDVIHYHS